MQMLAMHINRQRVNVVLHSILMLVLTCLFGPLCLAQASTHSGCHTSTVADAWGPEFASQAKDFFVTLQAAVKSEDEKQFASLVQYPLHVYGASEKAEINSSAELLHKYTMIITPDARKAILAQSPDCLFGNGQGVMAAGGRVWFQKQEDGKFKIVTLNVIRRVAHP